MGRLMLTSQERTALLWLSEIAIQHRFNVNQMVRHRLDEAIAIVRNLIGTASESPSTWFWLGAEGEV